MTSSSSVSARMISPSHRACSRDRTPDIIVINPADAHYCQPGQTMVRAGVFRPATTPRNVQWSTSDMTTFEPEWNSVILDGYRVQSCKQVIVCSGPKLDWHAIDALPNALGHRNGVTSNYHFELPVYEATRARAEQRPRIV